MQVEYFARAVHGGHRVRKLDSGIFEVDWPTGSIQYPSVRKTLIAITSRNPHPGPGAADPKVGFARYFKLKHAVSGLNSDTLALFSPKRVVSGMINPPKGIDLAKRGHEVAKLFYAGFARSCVNYGYDPEDVLQEVYKGILIRNKGTCPFDASKSTFGHYVHLIIKCVLANYHRKWDRVTQSERLGIHDADGGLVDAAASAVCPHGSTEEAESSLLLEKLVSYAAQSLHYKRTSTKLTREVAEKMAMGFRKSDIEALYRGEYRPFMVEQAILAVKDAAQHYRGQLG